MSLTINYIGTTEISHINLRKQGPDDDKVLAIDVKLVGVVDAKVLRDLLALDPEDNHISLFWRADHRDAYSQKIDEYKDVEYDLRTHQLNGISIKGEWPGRIVTFGKKQTITADVGKVSFELQSDLKIKLTLTVQIDNPADTLLDYLVHRVKESINCKIESQPDLVSEAQK